MIALVCNHGRLASTVALRLLHGIIYVEPFHTLDLEMEWQIGNDIRAVR